MNWYYLFVPRFVDIHPNWYQICFDWLSFNHRDNIYTSSLSIVFQAKGQILCSKHFIETPMSRDWPFNRPIFKKNIYSLARCKTVKWLILINSKWHTVYYIAPRASACIHGFFFFHSTIPIFERLGVEEFWPGSRQQQFSTSEVWKGRCLHVTTKSESINGQRTQSSRFSSQ